MEHLIGGFGQLGWVAAKAALLYLTAVIDFRVSDSYSHSSAIMFATSALQPVWCDAPSPRPVSPSKYS